MALRLNTIAELDNLGLPAELLTQAKSQLAATKSPIVGDLQDLIAEVKALSINLKEATRAAKKAEGTKTRLHWQIGERLAAIKATVKHGDWLPTLGLIGISDQRAGEFIKIAAQYPSETEAAKHTVRDALKAIKRDPSNYNAYENCFATPDWLREAITRDYGFPALDVCASHGKHFGERWYSPEDNEAGAGAIAFDGLAQDWVVDSRGGFVFCNPPYSRTTITDWLVKIQKEAARGCIIVCVLPYWASDNWFMDYVRAYGEIRSTAERVSQKGFGPKEGKRAGGKSWDTILVVFRKGQSGSHGDVIYPVGKEPSSVLKPHANEQRKENRTMNVGELRTAIEQVPDETLVNAELSGKLRAVSSAVFTGDVFRVTLD